MPSLITKWKKGKPYLYWVRSAWVNGHSRIVEQLYLGPREGVMAQLHAHVTSAPPPPGRRPSLSVGHYLVLAAINRAAWPKSKRAFTEWYQGTALARLVPALPDELRSQRFWGPMDLFEPESLARIRRG